MNARTIVLPDSRIEIGVPTASGNCAWMARAKRRSVSLSLGSPFGNAWTRTRPSAAIHWSFNRLGRLCCVTGPACR